MITRVEVIDETGRVYTNYSCDSVEVSNQDGGKTLKIFLRNVPIKPLDYEFNKS